MLIKICTDTWRDIFDFISPTDRRRLALKFNEVKDREFSDLCQKWLHEWVKNVCLGELYIDSHWYTESARLITRAPGTIPFAEVEMPANINDFERIEISYLDTTVLNFLRHLQPLFRGVNLHVYFYEKSVEAMRTALTHLMPLFSGGIEYIRLNSNSNQLLPTIRDNFQAQFLGIKILSMRGHAVGFYEFVELYLPWLSTIRVDGQPRTLSIELDNTSAVEIIDRIRQDFLDASGPVSFFISFPTERTIRDDILGSTTQNAITGEQLVIGKPLVDENAGIVYLLIGRCPSVVDGQTWIEEMHKKMEEAYENEKRSIVIIYPRQIEVAQQQMDGNEVEENGEEEEDADQKPGPSNRI